MLNSMLSRTGLRVMAGRSLQRNQRRNMGDGPYTDAMHVKKNKYVEEWNGRREITEQAFEVGPKNIVSILVCCVGFPYLVYYMTRTELLEGRGDPRYKRSGLA